MLATILVRRSALMREIRFLGPAVGREEKKKQQGAAQGKAVDSGLSDGIQLPDSDPDTAHGDGPGGDSGHSPGDSGFSGGDSGGSGTSD